MSSYRLSERQRRHSFHRTAFRWLSTAYVMRGKYPKTDYPIIQVQIHGGETEEARELARKIEVFVGTL